MKSMLRSALALAATTLSMAAWSANHAGADMSEAEVRKVDKAAGKVTLKHGEIKNLDMPPMTMVFQVKDSALLEVLKAGDKIRFAAEKTPSGYVVTAIEAAK